MDGLPEVPFLPLAWHLEGGTWKISSLLEGPGPGQVPCSWERGCPFFPMTIRRPTPNKLATDVQMCTPMGSEPTNSWVCAEFFFETGQKKGTKLEGVRPFVRQPCGFPFGLPFKTRASTNHSPSPHVCLDPLFTVFSAHDTRDHIPPE